MIPKGVILIQLFKDAVKAIAICFSISKSTLSNIVIRKEKSRRNLTLSENIVLNTYLKFKT